MRAISLATLFPLLLFCFSIPAVGRVIDGRPSANRPVLPQPISPEGQTGFSLPPAPQVVAPDMPADNLRILLRAVKFEGNTAITDMQLQAIAKPYLNHAVSLADLEALRLAFSQYYVDKGYINSGAVLPEQAFKDGVIHFQIIEGELSRIQVSGTERLNPDYIANRLRLGAKSPLNFNKLQERFQMLLADPLIERMNGQLKPGSQPGESIFDVKVVRKRPYQVSLTIDNHRPPSVGAEQATLAGWVRNLTGWGDEIDWNMIYSEGSLAGGGGLTIPLNRYDTRFHFDFSLAQTTVIEEAFAGLDVKSRYNAYNYTLSQPLYQSLQHNLGFSSTLSIRQNRSSFNLGLGDNEDGWSQSTAIRNAFDYTYQDEQQAVALRSTLSVGIHAFGATWWGNKKPDSDFVSWLNQLQYVRQIMDNGSQLLFNGTVQWANDELLPLERFALGGSGGVRGYRENELVRDQGYLLSLEFHYPLLNGDRFPGKLSLAPFMDYGSAWNYNESASTLYSIGTGLIWKPFQRVQAEIYYAYPLNAPLPQKEKSLQDAGIHFSVSLSAF